MSAELVVGGRIVTLDRSPDARDLPAGAASPSAHGLGIVDAIAIGGGRVVAAGRAADVEPLIGPGTRRLDLAPDEVALPGLSDSHLHLADAAVAAGRLDLEGAPTLAAGLALVNAAHERMGRDGGWLRGGGWDAGRWGAWPVVADLELTAPGRPVLLWAHDLHSVWVSATALVLAGVDAGTPNPPGGRIRRLADGAPAGVLHEDATLLVTRFAPSTTGDELAGRIETYARHLLALGVVAVHEPGELEMDSALEHGFAAIERLASAGRLPIRVHAGLRRGALDVAIARGVRSGAPLGDRPDPAEGRARVGWLKLFGDGTLGSRTAALLANYETDPEHGDPPAGPLGLLVTSPEEMVELSERAAQAGIATQIHAIGDRALRAALDALAPMSGRTTLRPRIEHVQLVDGQDLPRFAAHGIVASVQPHHVADDAPKARRDWGDRAQRSYPWRSLVESGAIVAFGTDAPADSEDPWPGLAMALTRRDPGWPAGVPAFGPHEALTLPQALWAACVAPAVAAGEPDRGRLTVGQRADLIVVPAAILRDVAALRVARPRLVLVDGSVAYET
jgi:predicted amidohydrolase YtcJ